MVTTVSRNKGVSPALLLTLLQGERSGTFSFWPESQSRRVICFPLTQLARNTKWLLAPGMVLSFTPIVCDLVMVRFETETEVLIFLQSWVSWSQRRFRSGNPSAESKNPCPQMMRSTSFQDRSNEGAIQAQSQQTRHQPHTMPAIMRALESAAKSTSVRWWLETVVRQHF